MGIRARQREEVQSLPERDRRVPVPLSGENRRHVIVPGVDGIAVRGDRDSDLRAKRTCRRKTRLVFSSWRCEKGQ